MTTTLAGGIKRCKKSFVFFLSIASLSVSSAFAADGAKIFKQNCAVCHRLDAQKLVGPGFAGLSGRVPSDEWLFKWIKNNDALRKSGDAYAVKVFQENGGAAMTTFEGVIPDEDIKTLIEFIKNPPKEVAIAPVASKVSPGGNAESGSSGNENGSGAGY